MPATSHHLGTSEPITETTAEDHIQGICFKTGPPRHIGVELEWFLHDPLDPARPVDPARLTTAVDGLRTLFLRSRLTTEPGGQLELSSLPATSLTACVNAAAADLDSVRHRLRQDGLALAGHGHDPWRRPRRLLDEPRYAAMEAYFDRTGPAGRSMMCSTASVQVCLDSGTAEPGPFGLGRRWLLSHLLGAVLVAAFANSPLSGGRPTGWKSTRQAVWGAIDPGRTLAPAPGPDPRAAWTAYALDAPVLCIRGDEGPWTVPEDLTFRQWIRSGAYRPPTTADLDYHLSTLFPPVRPRGYLELRMIDAQSGRDGWIVPLAVATALFDDAAASEIAYRAVKPLADAAGPGPAPRNPLWQRAARHALADPELHATAVTCFAAAREALPRLGASDAVQAVVADFTERFVLRGRCPADDLLDAFRRKEYQS
ncbi:ergothioneine biosynthesis glutamate--cysteine ligase EgtA [Streptomyces sp. NPDC088733]|uniref:ergothioneine biosynthesis glutamate--cysteine ligase EgtA n=1 Tax=Streptomyces sp. NPDC088733 TaxID=3365880 RepID=UPI003810FE42